MAKKYVSSARYLKSGTGEGHFVKACEIDDWMAKMIGFECDGESAYNAKGIITRELSWIFMFWCFCVFHVSSPHRLELSA